MSQEITIVCAGCEKPFLYIKRGCNYRNFCDVCKKSRKKGYQDAYRDLRKTFSPLSYCVICKLPLVKSGSKAHKQCFSKYLSGMYQVERNYWETHLQKCVIEDESSCLI